MFLSKLFDVLFNVEHALSVKVKFPLGTTKANLSLNRYN